MGILQNHRLNHSAILAFDSISFFAYCILYTNFPSLSGEVGQPGAVAQRHLAVPASNTLRVRRRYRALIAITLPLICKSRGTF